MRRSGTLSIALAAVFAMSFYSYAQLGGPAGIDLPYQGLLESDGDPFTDPAVDFRIEVYDSAVASTPCDTIEVEDVVVVAGRFTLVVEDIPQACVVGKDVHLELAIDPDQSGTPVELAGRQRVFPALAAMTSGTGDFVVPGTLTVDGAASFGAVSATGVTTSGNIRNTAANGELGASANFVFRDTGDTWLRLNSASGTNAYADLAVGDLWAGNTATVLGDFVADGNMHGHCYWASSWLNPGNAIPSTIPSDCTSCLTEVCSGGYYVAGFKVGHSGGDPQYWTGLRVAQLCCRL